jgi:beta-glucosidase/6-phospho-beta-glucosidase/beta-galactosidase
MPKSGSRGPLFKSFWIAGYESACHINSQGIRQDLVLATQHDTQVDADYALLAEAKIKTVREAIRWPRVENSCRRDFSSVLPMLEAAQRHDIQVIWNICHFGWPDGIDVFAPEFVTRFTDFSGAVARFMKEHGIQRPSFIPINEISFLSWAAGDVGWFFPHAKNRGGELKRQLVKSALSGIDAIWSELPDARIVHIDPVLHVVPRRDRPDLSEAAAIKREGQFESWDMISGRMCPELGGNPRYLDIVGINYYHSNQFEHEGERLFWEHPKDNRRIPFGAILREIHERYGRPMFIGETSHFGVGRGEWIIDIAQEVLNASRSGVPVGGICLYPIIDRPDWEDPKHWHNSGLWDLIPQPDGRLDRTINRDYAEALKVAQDMFAELEPA